MSLLFGIGVVIGICIVITAVVLGLTYLMFSGLGVLGRGIVGGLKNAYRRWA